MSRVPVILVALILVFVLVYFINKSTYEPSPSPSPSPRRQRKSAMIDFITLVAGPGATDAQISELIVDGIVGQKLSTQLTAEQLRNVSLGYKFTNAEIDDALKKAVEPGAQKYTGILDAKIQAFMTKNPVEFQKAAYALVATLNLPTSEGDMSPSPQVSIPKSNFQVKLRPEMIEKGKKIVNYGRNNGVKESEITNRLVITGLSEVEINEVMITFPGV